MSDETTESTEVQAEETQQEAAPALTKEQIADAIGVEVDDLDKVKNLKKWERDLNRVSTEMGAARKESPPKADDDYDWSDDQLKMFRAGLKKLGMDPDDVSFVTQQFKMQTADELEGVTSDFFKKNKDITQDDIAEKILDLGIPIENLTPAKAKRVLESAAKMVRSEKSGDIDAKVAAEVEKRLAELAPKDGETILEVKPKKGAPSEGHKSVEDALGDPNLSFEQMVDLAARLPD